MTENLEKILSNRIPRGLKADMLHLELARAPVEAVLEDTRDQSGSRKKSGSSKKKGRRRSRSRRRR